MIVNDPIRYVNTDIIRLRTIQSRVLVSREAHVQTGSGWQDVPSGLQEYFGHVYIPIAFQDIICHVRKMEGIEDRIPLLAASKGGRYIMEQSQRIKRK